MTTYDQTTLSGLENQAFALMGRMHVILRRQNGRVTDIEYMRIDPSYCRYLLDMASQLPNEDLRLICEKLNEVYFGADGLFVRARPRAPLMSRIASGPAIAIAPAQRTLDPLASVPPAMSAPPLPGSADATVDRTYIGRLR